MSTKRMAKWVVKATSDGQWMVVLKAGNGEPQVWSEAYTRKADANRALVQVIRSSLEALMP